MISKIILFKSSKLLVQLDFDEYDSDFINFYP